MTTTTVIQRELYAELGQMAAAFRIEGRRHFDRELSALLERGADLVVDIRSRYWVGKITDRAALVELAQGRAIIEAVAEWDA